MDMFHGPEDPVYTISVASRLLGVAAHLLRQFEMEGLVMPARTGSNIRLYSDNDLRLLARVIYLSKDCGINIQGVRVILAMEGGFRKSPAPGVANVQRSPDESYPETGAKKDLANKSK